MRALLLLPLLTAASPGREALGQYGRWGAFREGPPQHCFAIAEPAGERRGAGRPFVAVSNWPGRRIAAQLHVRLREVRPGQQASLRIGTLHVPLLTGTADAWAHDAREDARITAAMRQGGELVIESRLGGRHTADRYPLTGAASAIDAAAVGCLD